MARTGRPTELTPLVQQRVVYALINGSYRKIAAEYAGIDYRTMLRWMTEGKKTSKKAAPYREFRRSVLNAEKQSEVDTIATVLASKDPKHLLDLAGRRWPERWGKNTLELKTLTKEVGELKATIQSLLVARGRHADDTSPA